MVRRRLETVAPLLSQTAFAAGMGDGRDSLSQIGPQTAFPYTNTRNKLHRNAIAALHPI